MKDNERFLILGVEPENFVASCGCGGYAGLMAGAIVSSYFVNTESFTIVGTVTTVVVGLAVIVLMNAALRRVGQFLDKK